ncbi:ethylene-responsive nuclear protein [Solanum lycopersicum]|uniref:Ethylene-responsive nuclear protein n=1 Tax=Solanum lycopersicum TaxID=4081 RepID=A0A3Q7EWL3_SOLLC|nr:ethylene-responsive nuclear protein [Solanum lycopersicum]
MPFPWKKVKKTSISQLVKDHVNSQSGSPLMVETGFPTSLVDFVVKNRRRFKKSSKKKMVDDPLFVLNPPSSVTLPSTSEFMIDDNEVPPMIRVPEVEGDKPESRKMNDEKEWGYGCLSMNQGLVAVLKMFLVAALVLGMNNLVVGVTMSAFLLFFLEYLGERLYGFFYKAPLELSKDGCSDFRFQIQEIEAAQGTNVEDSQCIREKIEEESIWDGKGKCVGLDVIEKGEEYRYDLCESKEKKSHRAKMKSKMKKLVLKKFRKKKGSALERPMLLDDIDYVIEGKKETEGSSEQKMPSNSIVSSVASSIDDKTDIVEVVGNAGVASEVLTDASIEESFNGTDDKATIVGEEELTGREHSSMYIALLLVVLVGLIGGRVLALVFTLSCCLMLKRGEGIGRFTKLPVMRRFTKKFC